MIVTAAALGLSMVFVELPTAVSHPAEVLLREARRAILEEDFFMARKNLTKLRIFYGTSEANRRANRFYRAVLADATGASARAIWLYGRFLKSKPGGDLRKVVKERRAVLRRDLYHGGGRLTLASSITAVAISGVGAAIALTGTSRMTESYRLVHEMPSSLERTSFLADYRSGTNLVIMGATTVVVAFVTFAIMRGVAHRKRRAFESKRAAG